MRQLGRRALPVRADSMSFDDIRSCANTIQGEFGAIDILVNNAGGGTGVPNAKELSPEQLDERLFAANVDLNLFSAYRASKAVLPGMLERRYGRIINIGSGYAKRSGGPTAYTAAKHGLIGLTRAMAAEVARQGVTINCLCPSWTNTKLVDLDAMAVVRGRFRRDRAGAHRVGEPAAQGPRARGAGADGGALGVRRSRGHHRPGDQRRRRIRGVTAKKTRPGAGLCCPLELVPGARLAGAGPGGRRDRAHPPLPVVRCSGNDSRRRSLLRRACA